MTTTERGGGGLGIWIGGRGDEATGLRIMIERLDAAICFLCCFMYDVWVLGFGFWVLF
jgi:hypothetical protein